VGPLPEIPDHAWRLMVLIGELKQITRRAYGSRLVIKHVSDKTDAARHPALLMVDSISGLASADYRHDEWGVDVTVSGSQKGLMLPPGISFKALSPEGAGARQNGAAAAFVLGLGRDRGNERGRLLALHAEHEPAVRAERSTRHAAPARTASGFRAPPALGQRRAAPQCRRGACSSSARIRCCIRRC
jgi:hypothetical protein